MIEENETEQQPPEREASEHERLVNEIFWQCMSQDACEYRRDSDRQCMDIGWCTNQQPKNVFTCYKCFPKLCSCEA